MTIFYSGMGVKPNFLFKMMNIRILTTLLFCIGLLGSIKAQTPALFSQNWTKPFQHTDTDNYSNESRKVVVNPTNGDSYVLADVTSDMDQQGVVTGTTYNFVVLLRFDSNSDLLNYTVIDINQHSQNGTSYKSGFGLELDASGYVYAGYMSYDVANGYDVNLAKFSTSLNNIWTYTFNPSTNEEGTDMKVNSAGEVFALVKSVAPGNLIRQRVIKASGGGSSTNMLFNFNLANDFLLSLALDPSSNLYITGYRVDSGVKSILVTSLTSTGVMRWLLTDNCGTNFGDDIGKHITFSNDGFLYITGSSLGTVQHGIDVVTMKFDPSNGKKVWENFINYTLSDGGFKVNVPDASTCYVAWTAGSSVFVDLISANSGNLIRRAAYTPVTTTPANVDEISISDFAVSPSKIVYVTGNVLATNLVNQSFYAGYLIKVNFSARGSSRIEAHVPVEGNFAISTESKSIGLDPLHNRVVWLYDQTNNYISHQQEVINISGYQHLNGHFKIGNGNHFLPSVSVAQSSSENMLMINSEEAVASYTITNLSGQVVYSSEKELNNNYQFTINTSGISAGVYLMNIIYNDGKIYPVKVFIN